MAAALRAGGGNLWRSPYQVASMGMAYTRGLQSADLNEGVVATGKHFAVPGIPEGVG